MRSRILTKTSLLLVFSLLTIANTHAQDIETLVMPGEVIRGHVEYESECSACHKMFDKGGQRELCLDCHEDVAADVSGRSGYHGLFGEAREEQCATCHTEHEGRDAIVVILDEPGFDHLYTDFELLDSHLEAECADCHAPGDKHRDAASDCAACHGEDEPHAGVMGDDCGSCHQPTEWLEAEFDHSTTDYPLLGNHLDTACLDCHEDRTFPAPPTDCVGCHLEDDAHDGRSGEQCENCHNPTDWHDSSFDHLRDTDFELLGSHASLACGDCHSDNPFEDTMDMNCVSCHLEDDAHDKHRGDECDSCHASTKWAEPVFDHDVQTDFLLRGGHRELACNDCHVEPVFVVELENNCESCHRDDEPHAGSLGSQCANCHTEVSWQDPVFFDHDLGSFPLLGLHADNDCGDCHASQEFGNTGSDCVGCHVDDDPHSGNFDEQCESCHNPVGWDRWTFDHNTQTEFALTGAHVEVACDDCHRTSLASMQSTGGSCGSCHRSSDAHDGEFGFDCGRCHSADSFREVRSVQ